MKRKFESEDEIKEIAKVESLNEKSCTPTSTTNKSIGSIVIDLTKEDTINAKKLKQAKIPFETKIISTTTDLQRLKDMRVFDLGQESLIRFWPHYLSKQRAEQLFNYLMENIQWKQSTWTLRGGITVLSKRQYVVMGDKNALDQARKVSTNYSALSNLKKISTVGAETKETLPTTTSTYFNNTKNTTAPKEAIDFSSTTSQMANDISDSKEETSQKSDEEYDEKSSMLQWLPPILELKKELDQLLGCKFTCMVLLIEVFLFHARNNLHNVFFL